MTGEGPGDGQGDGLGRTHHILGLTDDIGVATSDMDRGFLTGSSHGSTWGGEYPESMSFPAGLGVSRRWLGQAWPVTGPQRTRKGATPPSPSPICTGLALLP